VDRSSGTPRSATRATLLLAVALATVMLLWRLRPVAPAEATTPDADVVRGCGWLAWILVEYLAVAVAAASMGHLATGAGRFERGLRRVAPRPLRRLVDLAVTASLATAVLGSASVGPALAVARDQVHGASASRLPPAGAPLDWPGLTDSGPLARPTSSPASPLRPPAAAPRRRQHADAGLVSGGHPNPTTAAAGHEQEVVVQAGDTLWSIAQRELGARAAPVAVSLEWRRWYTANRPVIGADPGRIYPGQRLRPPPARPTYLPNAASAPDSAPTHDQGSPR
jgi:resuscitation-promoting factor RpfA